MSKYNRSSGQYVTYFQASLSRKITSLLSEAISGRNRAYMSPDNRSTSHVFNTNHSVGLHKAQTWPVWLLKNGLKARVQSLQIKKEAPVQLVAD